MGSDVQTPKGPGVQDEEVNKGPERHKTCDDAIVTCSSGTASANSTNLASEFLGLTTDRLGGTMYPMNIFSRLRTLMNGDPQPKLPPALQEGELRIHLLSADFTDADAAMAYCFHAEGDAPEQITFDQPSAFIDTGFVEVVHRNPATRLADFLPAKDVDRTIAKMKGVNTLIIITEDAFGGFPYVLTSNKIVYYIGPIVVDV